MGRDPRRGPPPGRGPGAAPGGCGRGGDGTSGVTSSLVAADAPHRALAYVSGANPSNATLDPALADPNAILVAPRLVGDWNLDGTVDRFDVRSFNAHIAFNDGLATHDWD